MIFYGIADCHGLESFKNVPYQGEFEGFQIPPGELSMMKMRVMANTQRHAVVYKADVSVEVAKEILDLIDEGEYVDALEVLKKKADEISLMKSPGAEKMWSRIPDPELDPFH